MDKTATRRVSPLAQRVPRAKLFQPAFRIPHTSSFAETPFSASSAGSSGTSLSAGSMGISPLPLKGVPLSQDGSRVSAPLLGNGKPTMVSDVGQLQMRGETGARRERSSPSATMSGWRPLVYALFGNVGWNLPVGQFDCHSLRGHLFHDFV